MIKDWILDDIITSLRFHQANLRGRKRCRSKTRFMSWRRTWLCLAWYITLVPLWCYHLLCLLTRNSFYKWEEIVLPSGGGNQLGVDIIVTMTQLAHWGRDKWSPYDIFKCILLNENIWIEIKILLKFVFKGPINNTAPSVTGRRQAIIWTNGGLFTDAYMRHLVAIIWL